MSYQMINEKVIDMTIHGSRIVAVHRYVPGLEGEDPNEFMKNHDVVNVSTLRDEGWDELTTVVTYEDEENDKD